MAHNAKLRAESAAKNRIIPSPPRPPRPFRNNLGGAIYLLAPNRWACLLRYTIGYSNAHITFTFAEIFPHCKICPCPNPEALVGTQLIQLQVPIEQAFKVQY